mmetsp:Transcript_57259/g.127815  ORF Transcript_57259/g.127815 Transcript_57259/m.127815 type:complete len:110 (+) Transcript_57259:1144-1473(+)
MTDMFVLWNRYVSRYRPCELKGTGWRSGHGKSEAWGQMSFLFREVAKRYDELGEAGAVREAEGRRKACGSWRKFLKVLKIEQPEGAIRTDLKSKLTALSPEPTGAVSAS